MSTRKIVINAAVNWTGTLVQMAAVFFLAPVLVHGLGDRRYGIWALIESIVAYLAVFDLGIGAALVRYVARCEGMRDLVGIRRVFSTCFFMFAVAGAAALGVASLILGPAWKWIPVPGDLRHEAWWLLALLAVNLAIGLPMGVFAALLDGLQHYPSKMIARSLLLVVRCAATLVIVFRGGGLIALALLTTGLGLIEYASMAALAWWHLPGLRLSLSLVDRGTLRMIQRYSIDAFLAMIAGRVSFQTDALVIGAFLPTQYITFFALGARLVEYSKSLLRSLTTVLTPVFSQFEARDDLQSARRVWLNSTRLVLWLIVPVQVGLWVLGRPFLSLWIGPEHATRSYSVLAILTAPLSLVIAQSVSGRVLYGTGHLRWFSRMVILEAFLNLLMSLALVRSLGIEGVAWGTAIPNLIFNVVVAGYTLRLLNCRLSVYLAEAIAPPHVVGMVPALIWWGSALWFPPRQWLGLVCIIAAGVLIYAALAALAELGQTRISAHMASLGGRLGSRSDEAAFHPEVKA
jgi:O-antigen/teichoic acid export membrane protein